MSSLLCIAPSPHTPFIPHLPLHRPHSHAAPNFRPIVGVWGRIGVVAPSDEGSKTGAFKSAKRLLGLLGVKVDRYVHREISMEFWIVGFAGLRPAGWC
jgi:hypothetical protein